MTVQFCYRVISETCGDPELEGRVTCGLLAETISDSRWTHIQTLHDVSPDLDLVMLMADQFNVHQLHPIHLQDAVEDMLP